VKRKKLRVLPKARADLVESSFFYELETGEALARRFESAAEESFEQVVENPGVGSPTRFRSARLQGLPVSRIRGFEKHLVLYREVDDAVEVVRVLHGARDIEAILESEE